mmetsp:Transcript_38213/g.89839  ORF Transcript_38213/g.89839 Transcript_38213/m.89839 type:complete len:228 (-) Transcript_38213:53-736(-)
MPVHREAPPAPANRTQKRANGSVLLAHELAEDARRGDLLALGQHLLLGLALAQRRLDVLDANGVDAVPLVGVGHLLSLEDVAQVAAAAAAHDLDAGHPHAFVGHRDHAALDDPVEGGPTAAAVELGGRRVERLLAARAHEVAVLGRELVVLARARPLGALLPQHAVLLARQALPPLRLALLHCVRGALVVLRRLRPGEPALEHAQRARAHGQPLQLRRGVPVRGEQA